MKPKCKYNWDTGRVERNTSKVPWVEYVNQGHLGEPLKTAGNGSFLSAMKQWIGWGKKK